MILTLKTDKIIEGKVFKAGTSIEVINERIENAPWLDSIVDTILSYPEQFDKLKLGRIIGEVLNRSIMSLTNKGSITIQDYEALIQELKIGLQ
jgi:hypothetical protein